jgi:hypothetical protein
MTGGGNVVANNNDLSGSSSGVAVNNSSTAAVNATSNYWGTSDSATIVSMISGSNVSYDPYYVNAARTHLNTDIPDQVYVDPSYSTNGAGSHEYGWDAFATIQEGIDAVASAGTVHVAAGTYTESPSLNKAVNLAGADKTSTFVVGKITVNAASSSISGFDLSNPTGDMAVLIKHVGSVSVTGNNIHDVSLTGSNDYGVWFQSSGTTDVSDITVSDNTISNIGSGSNAKTSAAIGLGDSSSHMSISGLQIEDNVISNIKSSTKGAYGILLNLGASSSLTADTAAVNGASITGNDISGLSGGWEHAIGLETNTPNAVVTGNIVHDLAPVSDIAAVRFEKNPSASTVSLSGSTFDGKSLSNSTSSVTVDPAAPVVASSSELNTYPEYLVGDTYEYAGLNTFTTIQAAIDGVDIGGTVNVPAGNFVGSINVNKPLTLDGAGSGTDPGSNTVVAGSSGTGLNLSAGTDATHRVIVKDLRVSGFTTGIVASSYNTLNNVVSTGNSSYGISLNTLSDLVIADSSFNNNNVGLKLGSTASADHVTITDSHFDNNSIGWYSDKGGASSSFITNLSVSDTSFSNDTLKGFYTEKLSDSSFTNITVDNSGYSGSFSSGFNINLKYGDYHNITITNPTVTNSGTGDASQGTGINIEARDDGSYGANPATLEGVTISGGKVSGNQVGLRFGESAKNNAGPTNVTIHGVDLSGNIGQALNNQTQATITASDNWWGNALGPDSSQYSGNVTVGSWCSVSDCSVTQTASSGTVSLPSGPIATPVVSGGTSSVTIPSSNDIVASTATSAGTVKVTIPKGTVVTADDSTWDGTIQAPTVTSVSLGSSGTVSLAIEVGAGDIGLTFDNAVRLVLPGQAGKSVGFVRNGVFTAITSTCSADSQAAGDALAVGGNCYISVGGDLIVWTKHFTTFVAYAPASSSSGGSSSGNSDSGSTGSTSSGGTTNSGQASGGAVQAQSTDTDNGKTSSTNTNVKAPTTASVNQPKLAAKEAGGLRWYWIIVIAIVALGLAAMVAYRYAEGTDEA